MSEQEHPGIDRNPGDRFDARPLLVLLLLGVTGVVFYSLLGGAWKTTHKPDPRSPDTTGTAYIEALRREVQLGIWAKAPDPDREALAKATDLVSELLAQGVLTEASVTGDGVRVTVGPSFNTFTFKQKEGVCVAVALVFRSQGGPTNFVLRDAYSNKEVGTYAAGKLDLK